jgi:hypothetical protein
MVSKSISFGIQNFLFVTQDETDPVYVYVGYQEHKGGTLIGRYRKDDTEALYYSVAGVFATIWAARTTHTYVLPVNLVEPTV